MLSVHSFPGTPTRTTKRSGWTGAKRTNERKRVRVLRFRRNFSSEASREIGKSGPFRPVIRLARLQSPQCGYIYILSREYLLGRTQSAPRVDLPAERLAQLPVRDETLPGQKGDEICGRK